MSRSHLLSVFAQALVLVQGDSGHGRFRCECTEQARWGRARQGGKGRAPFVLLLCRARAKRQANDEVQADMEVRVDENRAASGDNSPRSSSTQARRTLRSIAGCSNSLGVIATTSKLSSASIEISPD